MRILHVANFSELSYGSLYYTTDRKISNGLIRNGHMVYDFSYRDIARNATVFHSKKLGKKGMNARLIETADNFRPDLVLLGHSELVTRETLQHIKDLTRAPMAMWYVDAIYEGKNLDHIIERSDLINCMFFTTGGQYLQQLRAMGVNAHYFPNPVDGSIESLRNHEKDRFENNLIFCGRDKYDPQRRKDIHDIVSRLPTAGIKLYGCLGQPEVTGHAYFQALSQSKMGLNFSQRNDVELYTSDRLAQLAGNGLLTFTPEIPGLNRLYSEQEVVYFRDFDELAEKFNFYNNHDNERKGIAYSGWKKSHAGYNSTRVSQFMLETCLRNETSEEYAWTQPGQA